MKTFEVVLLGRSQSLRVRNFDNPKKKPGDFEMRPTSIRGVFIEATNAEAAKGLAGRMKRKDERILRFGSQEVSCYESRYTD